MKKKIVLLVFLSMVVILFLIPGEAKDKKKFSPYTVWHHGTEHIPNTYKIRYWDGVNWLDLVSTTNGRSYLKYPSTTPQEWWELI